jgi:hypothetical protein
VRTSAVQQFLVTLCVALSACKPGTVRPYFPPVTGAAQTEIELEPKNATAELADVLRSDSMPVTKVVIRDGYIETAWFNAATKRVARGRRLGPNVVQVRAWVDFTRQGHSKLTVETVYRPLADASLSPRDLDRQVPPDHPTGKRVSEIVTELTKLYTREPAAEAQPNQ